MNELLTFNNEEFGQVRTMMIDGKPYFVANDVAVALGYTIPKDAITRHCKGALKQRYLTAGGLQEIKIIPEGDIYRLIVRSKLPSAERFEKWVFDELLPALRQTGSYSMGAKQDSYMIADPVARAKRWIEEYEEKKELEESLTVKESENSLLAQKNLEWADRPLINSLVRIYGSNLGGDPKYRFSAAWNEFKKELLYKHSINLNKRIANYMDSRGISTPPRALNMLADNELPLALSTITAMCREKDIDISNILRNKTLLEVKV